jgi:hypothetical protein
MKHGPTRTLRSLALGWALPAALLLGTVCWSATSADALKISLPLLGSEKEGAKPVEVSLPSITVSLPGVSVSTPEAGVSLQAPAPSTPVLTTPSPPSQPVQAPAPSAPNTPISGSTGAGGSTSTTSAPAPAGSASSAQSSVAGSTETTTVPASSTAAPVRRSAKARVGRAASEHKRTRATPHHAATLPVRSLAGTPAPTGSAVAKPTRRSSAKRSRSSSPLASIGKEIPLPIPVPNWSKPIILALLLLAGFFALRSRLAALRAGRLEGQRKSLLRDLDIVQAAVVPEVPALIAGLGVSVAYRPADGPAAGGDFYDVFLAEPGKVVMILGDVSGHGHEAVSHAALTRYTLRAYMQAGLEPRAALALAGQAMANPVCEQFATVAVGVYRQHEGTFTYASAGHPPPIVTGIPTWTSSEACCSPPIGWSVPTGLRQSTVSLPAGAVVCFFTDGLPEARAGEDLLLGRERVEELLAALGPRPEAGELLEGVRAAALSTPDDMAACILRAEASGSAEPVHTEELEVDPRRLRGGALARFLADCRVPVRVASGVLAGAKTIAEQRGSALIRVVFSEHATSATVAAGTPRLPEALAQQLTSAQPAARPLSLA